MYCKQQMTYVVRKDTNKNFAYTSLLSSSPMARHFWMTKILLCGGKRIYSQTEFYHLNEQIEMV